MLRTLHIHFRSCVFRAELGSAEHSLSAGVLGAEPRIWLGPGIPIKTKSSLSAHFRRICYSLYLSLTSTARITTLSVILNQQVRRYLRW